MNSAKIKKITKDFFDHFSQDYEIKVEELNEVYKINIDTQNTGILIGFHGETLESLQNLLSQMVNKGRGESWVRISLNIGDYLEKREEKLLIMADSAVSQVLEEKHSVSMPFLNAKERRIIHTYLGQKDNIKTESIGDGEERRLVIFPQ